MASVSTTTPIPPSQCVRLRQNRNAFGIASMAGVSAPPRIVAPVVVNPLIVSKNASVYESSTPPSTNGSAPTSERSSHAVATITNPSRTRRSPSPSSRNAAYAPPPTPSDTSAVTPKLHHDASP